MSDRERTEFESNPYYQNAVHLRKWDDLAKVKNLKTPELETYRDAVAHCLKPTNVREKRRLRRPHRPSIGRMVNEQP